MFRYYRSMIGTKASIAMSGSAPRYLFDWFETNVKALMTGGTGGSGFRNYLHKSTYATDITSRLAGTIPTARANPAAAGNDQYGFHCGGYISNSTRYTNIDKTAYETDTVSNAGSSIPTALDGIAASGDKYTGWYGGGSTNGTTTTTAMFKIDYGTIGVSVMSSTLSAARRNIRAVSSNVSVYYGPGVGSTQRMEKMLMSSETMTTLSNTGTNRSSWGDIASTSTMYMAAGDNGSGSPLNSIQKCPFATDTVSNVVGVVSQARLLVSGTQSTTAGLIFGGLNGSTYYSTVDKFVFDTETSSAVSGLALSEALCFLGAAG